MPKIIMGLNETIVSMGKKILFKDGYEAMSMRRVADECGIAVGTIYNYVRNKQELLVRIVLKDWLSYVEDMQRKITPQLSFCEGVLVIYRDFLQFKEDYLETFKSVMHHIDRFELPYEMHPQLTEEIAVIIDRILRCEDEEKRKALRLIVSEMLIATAQHPDISEEMLRIALESLDIS